MQAGNARVFSTQVAERHIVAGEQRVRIRDAEAHGRRRRASRALVRGGEDHGAGRAIKALDPTGSRAGRDPGGRAAQEVDPVGAAVDEALRVSGPLRGKGRSERSLVVDGDDHRAAEAVVGTRADAEYQ